MKDERKTKEQLFRELAEMRQQIAGMQDRLRLFEARESEREQIEEALRKSEERLALALEASRAGIYDHFVPLEKGAYHSERWANILGYTRKELPPADSFMDWLVDRIHPDDLPRLEKAYADFVEGRTEAYKVEIQMRHKSGNWIHVQGLAKAVKRDENGRATRIVGVMLDITEHKQTEEALRESEEKFRAITENTTDVTFIVDQEGVYSYASPTIRKVIGYSPEEVLGKKRGYFTHPDDIPLADDIFARARREPGTTIPVPAIRGLHRDGRVLYFEGSTTGLPDVPGVNGVVINIRDITERVLAERDRDQLLEQVQRHAGELETRARELLALNTVGRRVTASLSLDQVVNAALEGTFPALDPDIALLFLREGDELHLQGIGPEGSEHRHQHTPVHRVGECLCGLAVSEGEPVFSIDICQDFRCTWDECKKAELHSFAALPLRSEEAIIGVLGIGSATERDFGERAAFLETLADHVSIGLQNALLHQATRRHAAELEGRVADRTQELSVLYDIASVASQPLDLETTLALSLERALAAVANDAGVIHLLDEADAPAVNGVRRGAALRLAVQCGLPPDLVAEMRDLPSDKEVEEWTIERRELLTVPHITPATEPRSYFGIPLQASGRVVGVLGIIRSTEQPPFNVEELSLLTSIADQLGIVVESTRLRQLAEQAAVMEERARLARDLHDSVTQLLYGINLFAKSGRNAYNLGDLVEVEYCLDKLGESAHQALKEMRLLVYELRPPALKQEGLVGALQRRLDAVEGRAGIATQLLTGDTIELPPTVERDLYHIALEALNNALKHANASSVAVSVDIDEKHVELQIVDDGSGFIPDAANVKGGLGIVGMRERTAGLGGKLTITSAPGRGTKVKVTVPNVG